MQSPNPPAKPHAAIHQLLVVHQALLVQEMLLGEADRQEEWVNRKSLLVETGRGIRKVDEWLQHRNPEVCVNAVGMSAANFQLLCDRMQELELVSNHRATPTRLRIAVTLYMLRKGAVYRTLMDEFQLSLRTLSL